MANLTLTRKWLDSTTTIGQLTCDDQTFGLTGMWTLEDTVRPPGIKVPGETAIPAGKYEVVITWSDRFQRRMPLLLEVPGFTGIRIHAGNTAADTEGCILVGLAREGWQIYQSKMAFNKLFTWLDRTIKREKVWITILTGMHPN